jgi:radical SAM superfamily enzyme
LVNSLPIRNVKLHNLHVLRETPLEGLFQNGQFLPIERELYAQRVQLFLENIRPDIFVQRLAAYSSRWNELVAPAWTADKMGTHQFLIDFLRERQSYQSKSLT